MVKPSTSPVAVKTTQSTFEPFRQKLKGKGIDLSSDLAIRAIKERRHFDKVKDNEKGGADAEDFIFRDIIKSGPFRGDTA